ncbi:MAG TPA: hypothetical protein VEC37_05965 [Bacillota bacterium]|nr:hypothetical protein [Bacillota bacterium]
MEELIYFLEKYIEDEHKMFIAGLSEKNVSLFKKEYENFKTKYYQYGIGNFNITTPRQPYGEYFERGKQIIANAIPRIIFQVKKYNHPEWGVMYRCYLSGTSPSINMEKNYEENFFIVKKDGDYNIISIYTTPIEIKKLHPDLREWDHRQGIEIKELGTLVEVKKFQPPEDPVQLEEYKAE